MRPTIRLILLLMLACGPLAQATILSWQPTPVDVWDLDHYKYYTWGIRDASSTQLVTDLATGDYQITGARLTLNNIYNWAPESADRLWIHLLDNVRTGTRQYTDNQGGGNAFANASILSSLGVPANTQVAAYTDPDDNASAETLTYNLASLGLLDELTAYLLSAPTGSGRAHFGFGFDPDCHYYNTGVRFELTYDLIPPDEPVVPEPATLGLLGVGLSLGGLLHRRKRARLA